MPMPDPSALFPTPGEVTEFFRGPRRHLETKYPNVNTRSLLFLIFSSLFLFIWEIIVLATIPGAWAMIALGQLYAAFMAMSDNLQAYTHFTFYIWLALDFIFVCISFAAAGRACVDPETGATLPSLWGLLACSAWLLVDIGQLVVSLRLRKRR